MAGTKGRGNSAVTTGELTILADPLHSGLALSRGETELMKVQSLPRRHGGGVAHEHPALHEPGPRGAEPAVAVEYQNRSAGGSEDLPHPPGHASMSP